MDDVIALNSERAYKTMTKGYHNKDPAVMALNSVKPSSYVLSAGCGAGREIDYLVNVLRCNVVGIDIDKKALELSKKKAPNAEYILGDMIKMKFKKKFDYVMCLWNTINCISRKARKEFVENSYDNLKGGGELILNTTHIFTHWRHLPCNIKHGKHFHPYPWEINEWFKDTKFKVTKINFNHNIIIRAKK